MAHRHRDGDLGECLAIGQYLNDVMIDFYLKYVMLELLTGEQNEKTHIFSTFFYTCLTTLDNESRANVNLTAAQKRHDRVKDWTKDVNLFTKDFIIIPINEQSHWFLAIICFPPLKGPHTLSDNKPVRVLPLPKKKAVKSERKSIALQIDNTTITPVSVKREFKSVAMQIGNTVIMPVSVKMETDSILLNDPDSKRDGAGSGDNELGTDDSEEEPHSKAVPIKQPCILIFDSLAGKSRNRVVATLRDYLTCEYRVKVHESTNHNFNKFNLPGHTVKVPQQTNYTDCGLYLLQYVEQFFKDPVLDYRLPIKQLINWFETLVVTKKREDISNLIIQLVSKYCPIILPLPQIQLPTENGVLIELPKERSVARKAVVASDIENKNTKKRRTV